MNYLLNHTQPQDPNIDSLFNTTGLTIGLQKWFLHSQPLLLKVFHFIEENYQNSISLREVAKAVDRSPSYLTDLVRQETGKTVLMWITERRMAEARRLLLKTSQKIEQIAEAVGYVNRRHFSRLFSKLHGTTPQSWRETYRGCSASVSPIEEISTHLINQRTKTMTATETERLQVCLQEIATILYNQAAS
ncbi:hypothetical protein NUACC21_31800 [Scytonema sp. NUACC21]